ncbi:MAG: hypothetical protein C0468_05015 [Planctomyces sp.]|nr:hypothetical protein [Planctomyces sp.]
MDERALITSWVMGELSQAEAARAAALEAARPDLAQLAAGLRATAAALGRAARVRSGFEVSGEALERLYGLGPRQGAGARVARAVAGAAALVMARLRADSWSAGALTPAVRGEDGSRRVVYESGGAVIDVRIDPSLARLRAYECVGCVQGVGAQRVVWTELDSGAEHLCELEADGFFEVRVRPGRHRIDVHTPAGVISTPDLWHPPEQAP